MKKSIFYIFLFFVIASIWIVISYLESNHFTLVFNKYLKNKIENQVGIKFEFDRISITPFPPSVSLINPRILKIEKENLLSLPTNYTMKTRELGISFRMLQLFGSKLVINRIYLNDAYIKAQIERKGRSKGAKIKVEDLDFLKNPIKVYLKNKLITIQIKQIEINNASMHLSLISGNRTDTLSIEKVKNLTLSKDNEDYYTILADLEDITANVDEVERKINLFRYNINISQDYMGIILMELQKGGLALSLKGNLFGDITKPKSMKGKLSLISRSNFDELSNIIPFFDNLKSVKGRSLSELELEGSFYSHALRGSLSIEDFQYSLWEFDRVKTNIKYSPGKISLQELKIEDEHGQISMSPIEIDTNENEIDKQVKFILKDVNFNKFSGDLRKSINPIKMNLSGELDLGIKLVVDKKSKDKKIQLERLVFQPKLNVKGFTVDNQEYDKIKPTKTIIQLADFFLDLKVRWEKSFLYFENGSIESEAGDLKVSGEVNDKKQSNINLVSEELDLNEFFSKILSTPIEGVGPFTFNILGPLSNLAFNFILDHKETKYLGLKIGHLKGELTYDTKVNSLFISNAIAIKSTGNYTLNGKVSEKSGINLDLQLKEMPLQEMFDIFSRQLKPITWIPYDARATVSGAGKISGGFANVERDIDVKINVNATNVQHKRERFSNLKSEIGLSKGIYYFKGLNLKKYNSITLGNLSYNTINKKLIYDIKTSNMRLQELDFFSRLRTAIDAPFSMEFKGEGAGKKFKSATNIIIEESDLGEIKAPGFYFEMKTDNEINSIYTKIGKENTEIFLDINKKRSSKSKLQMYTSGKEFSFLLCLINKDICRNKAELFINATLKSEWSGLDWKNMNGKIEFSSGALQLPELQISTIKSIDMDINRGSLKSNPIKLVGDRSEFFADLSSTSLHDSFFLSLVGKIDLGISKIFLPIIDRVHGNINVSGNMSISEKDKIKFNGSFDIENSSFFVEGLDTPIKNFKGKAALSSNEINIKSMNGKLGGGDIDISGKAKIFLNKIPEVDVEINLLRNRVSFFPVDYVLIRNGKLNFKGSDLPYSFKGNLNLAESLITRNFNKGRAYSKNVSSYLPLIALEDKPLYSLNIGVNIDNKGHIRNDIIDGEFKSKLLITNNFKHPRIFGEGRLINGSLFFRQTPFDIKYLNFRFFGKSESDPVLSLGASAKVKNYTVNMTVRGDTLKPNINFNSNPPLSQKSILYLLALGVESDRENLTEEGSFESLAYSEAGSFLLDQFNLSSGKNKGFSFNVTSSTRRNEADIIRPRNEASITTPKIKIHTSILKNVDAFMGTTIGSGVEREIDLNLEYRLSNKFSLKSVFEQEPGVNASETRSSYGADLKIQWVFE